MIERFQKIFIPSPRRVVGDDKGEGVQTKKNPPCEGYGCFLEQYINSFFKVFTL